MNGWMERISNGLDFGIVLLDETRRPTFASQLARRLLGSEGALDDLWPRLAARLEEAAGADLWQVPETTAVVSLPTDGAGAKDDGEDAERSFQVRVLAVDEEDCRGHLLLLRDTGRVEAAERDLWMASQMHSVARLYRAMAHDLRAPLNTMVVNLELLSDAVAAGAEGRAPAGGDPGERRRRYVRVLKEETERLSRQLLAFLSQTAPPRDAERAVDLGALVEEMALFVRPQAAQQGTELHVETPPEPVRVEGNPDRLRQALLSLVVNALEAVAGAGDAAQSGKAGGRVAIAVAVEGRGEAARAAVTVRDDGPGISPEVAGDLFDLHVSSKTDGSGIGLTVARRIAERHGGSLDVVPVDGPGACFRLALPLPAASEATPSRNPSSAPPHQES